MRKGQTTKGEGATYLDRGQAWKTSRSRVQRRRRLSSRPYRPAAEGEREREREDGIS
jgi:hypothetical protein